MVSWIEAIEVCLLFNFAVVFNFIVFRLHQVKHNKNNVPSCSVLPIHENIAY
jgi:hypothetical protein